MQRAFLPFGKPFRGIKAEYICSCSPECGNPVHIITCVDTSSNQITPLLVQQLKRMPFVRSIIFPENQILQMSAFIYDRQLVYFVFPYKIDCIFERNSIFSFYKILKWSHILRYFRLRRTAVCTEIAFGNNTDKFAVRCSVFRNGDR